MKTAVLRRTSTGDSGTFGILDVAGRRFSTGELPDRGNVHNLSSIPAGVYLCRWTFSPHFQRHTYELIDVPGRENVRIHVGNWAGDVTKNLRSNVDGCILLGQTCADIDGQYGVTASGDAIKEFERMMAGEDFHLAIVNEYLEAGTPNGKSAVIG